MFCPDIRLCCFGVHIWKFEVAPTYTPYGDQDGANIDGWCIICDRDFIA